MPAMALVRHVLVSAACCSILGGLVPARAQDARNYTISGEDGYGISDCMHAGSACGRVIADSWCESHGHAHALAFGLGSDVTGTTGTGEPVVKAAAGDVLIRCGD